MKTVVDYLKAHGKYKHNIKGCALEIELDEDKILLGYNGEWVVINAEQKGWMIESDIADILEDHNVEIRFCEECGKPFDMGYIAGDGDWYCCKECFNTSMDEYYGKGKWRLTDEEGSRGGFYENFDEDGWIDTGIYYTEWN